MFKFYISNKIVVYDSNVIVPQYSQNTEYNKYIRDIIKY